MFATYPLLRCAALMLAMLLAFEPAATAQVEGTATSDAATASHAPFSQQELDQMLAPIALYPDPLLSQILMASTYPLEVVEAARWSRSNPYLRGDDAVRAVEQQDWAPSVKSLVAFPQLLQMMDEKLDWTERLGDAFLAQEQQVMETVQGLRHKAYDAGNLRSNEQMAVKTEGQTIVILPASPEVVYVPYYNPTVVYGAWWWPAYPPVFWGPWPGYYFAAGFGWGPGITISLGFFFGDCDWPHHRVRVVSVNNFYYRVVTPPPAGFPPHRMARAPGPWMHDPDHRRGVPYRDFELRERYGRSVASPEARRFRGYIQVAPEARERGGARGQRGAPPEGRGQRGGVFSPPAVAPETRRAPSPEMHRAPPPAARSPVTPRLETRREPAARMPSARPGPAPQLRQPPAIRAPALQDIDRGSHVRDFSSRGRSSYEGSRLFGGLRGGPAQGGGEGRRMQRRDHQGD